MKRALLCVLLLCWAQPAVAAITYVTSANTDATASSATIAVTASGLTSGNTHLVVVWVKHEGTATNVSAADAGGNYINARTGTTTAAQMYNHSNGDLHAGFFYRSAITGVTSVTVTVTLAAARTFRTAQAWAYSYTSTDTITLDAQNSAEGSDAAPTSPNITTTGTDEIVLGGYGEYAAVVQSAWQVNALTADHHIEATSNFTSSWDEKFTTTFTGGHANLTIDTDSDWLCGIVALKATAGGGGAPVCGKGGLALLGAGC